MKKIRASEDRTAMSSAGNNGQLMIINIFSNKSQIFPIMYEMCCSTVSLSGLAYDSNHY